MSYTIADIKNELESNIHGSSLNKLQDPYGTINKAARKLQLDIDIPDTIRKTQITNAIYSNITLYSTPSDLKGDKIIDIRPQANRSLNDNFSQRNIEEFSLKNTNNTFSIEYDSGTKYLMLSKDVKEDKTLNGCDSLTANGTWSAGGDGTNLTLDDLYYVSGSGSLNFDLDGSTTSGYIENSDMTAQDLSDYEDVGSMFMWVYFPDSSIITNVILRWGNDSSNYWYVTATTGHDGNSFVDGWNLIRFDWNGATEQGTGDSSAVDYARVTITYDGTADTDIRVDNIVCRLGEIWDLVYYSNFLFQTSAGVWQENCSDDTDVINLSGEAYNLLIQLATVYANQELSGEDSSFDYQTNMAQYEQDKARYLKTNPSQSLKKQTIYYSLK